MRNPSSSSSSSRKDKAIVVAVAVDGDGDGDGRGGLGGRRGSLSVAKKKTPCCSKVGLKRGPWTPEEDKLLSNYIQREGEGRWRTLPNKAGLLRCGKSCRLRWMNYLRPSVKRGHIAPDEEDLILRLHRLLGNRWSLIAGRIPGRTDNEIKNYWNTHLSKKLISQGIDPRTHKPLESEPISQKTIPSNHDRQIQISSSNPTNYAVLSHPPPSLLEYSETAAANLNPDHHQYQTSTTTTPAPALFAAENGNHYMQNVINNIARDHDDDDDDHHHLHHEEDIIISNCCTDDAFSSFLNSLISEDVLMNSQNQLAHGQQQHHHLNNNNNNNNNNIHINDVVSSAEPLIHSSSSTSNAAGWDYNAQLMESSTSTTAFDHNNF